MKYILNKLNIDKEVPSSIFERVKLARELDYLKKQQDYNKTDNTKHYSENFNVLLFDLFQGFNYSKEVVDPFAGKGDLLFTLERFKKVNMYDIEPEHPDIIEQDTLMEPADYNNKYVVTNPPYLAKNKNKDKIIYDIYKVDDLYKASIKSIMNGKALGGCLIVPLNFLTDENTEQLRKEFFSKYRICNLNIFKQQMFKYTKYNTCSFNFFLGKVQKPIKTVIFDELIELDIELKEEYGYRLFGEFYELLNIPTKVVRHIPKVNNSSNILIHCIDGTKSDNLIRAEYVEELPVIKESDRNTFVASVNLTKEEQLQVIEYFNNFVNTYRNKYYNLIFTNYRENNRKRISFELAYKILQKGIDELHK